MLSDFQERNNHNDNDAITLIACLI